MKVFSRSMLRLRSTRWFVATVSFCAALAQYAEGGVPTTSELARGESIARQRCAACHVVAHDEQYTVKPGPDFADIASRPGVSATSVQHFITTTHWDVDKLPMSMPNPMLSNDDIRAVSSYILSLRKH
jgi:mono/diheme cytochrome c family protein